ncbi:MAG: hypothetical protein SX243_13470 [Acidobacteriota bacterium]|nr:hypothetical protein [Acidobacteriota bacterium]
MRKSLQVVVLVLAAAMILTLVTPSAMAADTEKLSFTGVNYTKWLWGTQRFDGSLYNFTTIPGEGFGDNGQGTELELLLHAKPSKKVEISGRLKARFTQNFWTNFGGFGNPDGGEPGSGDCVGGDCGEFDPRSAQYVKFRGLTATITPGYKWVDTVTIGSNDFGMFDPFTIGKIRYIDRDNGSGILFQGSAANRKFTYDAVRISLPRLWAGPNFSTGEFTTADGAYGLQLGFRPTSKFDFAVIYQYVNDIEVDADDLDIDDGRDIVTRFRNNVLGVRFGIHPNSVIDIRGAAYTSSADSDPLLDTPASFGTSGFSPVPAGELDDETFKLNIDLNDPFDVGLSFNLEYFDIGAEYVSMMAARRESDVLLTEGHDGAFAFPGPSNAAFGVFPGNPTRIGIGGWQGHAQQVATINVDQEFTDFEEPLAETVIGWKGYTIQPTLAVGDWDLTLEYTDVDYNTNWQAWNDPSRNLNDSQYPNFESDAGVGSFRNAYAPFQEKETTFLVLKADYFLDIGRGVDVFGKIKWIDETDKRMNDARFLPYQAGDCPGGGVACAGNRNEYSAGNSSADIYGNPPVITVNGVTGYQWKPFDSLSDDDRDMDYQLIQIGAGYQLTDELYASLTYENYDVDLVDGNTAFQAYQLHEMASGNHTRDKIMIAAKYFVGGAEFGLNYEYNTGEFDPDFGDGFVVQFADAGIAANNNVPEGSPGFSGRFGGWNSLATRDFEQNRLKVYMKIVF